MAIKLDNSPSSSISPNFAMPIFGSNTMTTKVWKTNVDLEMARMKICLKYFPLVAFDTEYPGIVFRTFSDSTDDEIYRAMKANVESTKLIQCGFTLFDDNGIIGGTWEFNFCNFGDPADIKNDTSIEFLVKNGLDLTKIRTDGVDMFGYDFFPKLLATFQTQRRVKFVTFQGAYDFAYFISILNKGKLPESPKEFNLEVVSVFGEVYDLKVMAGYCRGLGEHLGLSKLAQLLHIIRHGRAHHAGSDSLLTALVYIKINEAYPESKVAMGILYGMKKKNPALAPAPAPAPPLMYQHNLVPLIINNGYVPNYNQQQPPVFVYNTPSVPWMYCNRMYVPQLPIRTIPYQTHTPYGAHHTGVFPSY